MTSSREGQTSKRDGSRIVGEAQRRQDGEDASSIVSTLIYWQRLPGAPRKDYGLWRQDRFTRLVVGGGGGGGHSGGAGAVHLPSQIQETETPLCERMARKAIRKETSNRSKCRREVMED